MDSFVDFAERLATEIRNQKITEESKEKVVQLGNIMRSWVTPSNKEERLIREMWDAADQEEKETIAGVILRMAQRDFQQ